MNPKIKAIKAAMDSKFGFNSVRSAAELEEETFRIPTGSISLDMATGGGLPGGRMIHICGDFSAGKSALGYHILSNLQGLFMRQVPWTKYHDNRKKFYPNKWVLAEEGEQFMTALVQYESHSYSNDWGAGCGLSIEDLLIAYPDGLEEGLDIGISLIREQGVKGLLIDSYAAAKATKALEADSSGTYQMGIKPLKLDDFHGRFQATNNKLSREGQIPATLIALNQLREKIGAQTRPGMPPTQHAPGGKSKDYTASVEIHLRKGEYLAIGTGENKRVIGQQVKFKVTKNKTFPPYLTGSYDFYFDDGGPVPKGCIDSGKELGNEAVAFGVILRQGSHYYYPTNAKEHHIAASGTELFDYLRDPDNAETAVTIRRELYAVAVDKLRKIAPVENPDDEFEEDAVKIATELGVEVAGEEKPKKKVLKKKG